MNLTPEPDFSSNRITKITDTEIFINDTPYQEHLIFSREKYFLNLQSKSFAEIAQADLEIIAGLKTDIVLIGTGQQHLWPNQNLKDQLRQFNISAETMNNTALCRTLSLMSLEERSVCCLIFLGSVHK